MILYDTWYFFQVIVHFCPCSSVSSAIFLIIVPGRYSWIPTFLKALKLWLYIETVFLEIAKKMDKKQISYDYSNWILRDRKQSSE